MKNETTKETETTKKPGRKLTQEHLDKLRGEFEEEFDRATEDADEALEPEWIGEFKQALSLRWRRSLLDMMGPDLPPSQEHAILENLDDIERQAKKDSQQGKARKPLSAGPAVRPRIGPDNAFEPTGFHESPMGGGLHLISSTDEDDSSVQGPPEPQTVEEQFVALLRRVYPRPDATPALAELRSYKHRLASLENNATARQCDARLIVRLKDQVEKLGQSLKPQVEGLKDQQVVLKVHDEELGELRHQLKSANHKIDDLEKALVTERRSSNSRHRGLMIFWFLLCLCMGFVAQIESFWESLVFWLTLKN